MKCFYINLDAATDRRVELERDFARLAPAAWDLVRVRAVTPDEVADVPGDRSDPEKACVASHRKALGLAADENQPCLIVEDDTRFSRACFDILPPMADASDWDLLFTDLTLLNHDDLVTYFRRYRELTATRQFMAADLRATPFASSSAYMVNRAGALRLIELIDGLASVDQPYDLQLLRWVRSGGLAARLAFPFLTTVSAAGLTSSIQPTASRFRGAVIHALRELMFVERDLDRLKREVDALAADQDAATEIFGRLLGLTASDRFPTQI